MPTPIFNTGHEHGLAPSTTGLWDGITGTVTVVAGARTDGPGAFIMRFVASGANAFVTHGTSGHTTHVERLYWRFTGSLPPTRTTIFHVLGDVQLDRIGLTLQAGGNLVASVFDDSGSSYSEFGAFAVTTGVWYRLDFRTVLVPSTSNTISWSVDGVPQTGGVFSTGVTNTTYLSAVYGPREITTITCETDDIIESATGADYPIGEGGSVGVYVSQALPAEHQSITLSEWNYIDSIPGAGTNFASQVETDSRSRIGNFTTTTGIKLTGAALAGFTRWPMATAAFTSAPNAVQGYVMQMEESAGTDNAEWRISLGGGSTTAIYNATVPNTSMEIRLAQLARPGGGAWAAADLATLKFEGDSSDATPPVYLAGMALEIDAPADAPVGGNPVPFPPQIYGRGAA